MRCRPGRPAPGTDQAAGVAIVPEGRRLLPDLTVDDNLRALAQALIGAPRYLLVDELSLGLGPGRGEPTDPGDRRGGQIGRGRAADRSVATVALGVASRAHIMEGGRIRFSGQASELRDNPARLRSAYLVRGSTTSNNPERAGLPAPARCVPFPP